MGNKASAPQSEQSSIAYDRNEISQRMDEYTGIFSHPSQTECFRKNVPLQPVDFTEKFSDTKLNQIFLKARTPAGFNCNYLFRSSRSVADLILYSTDRYSVIQPLG